MNTLHNMRIFMRVAEAGGFKVAARRLNLTAGVVSRSIAELEAHLRVRLLNRTTRRTVLTEAGARYRQHCQRILASIDEAEAEAGDPDARPSGRLRVYVWTSFGQRHVVPAIALYQEQYPEVEIDVTLAQRMPNLREEGYDVALMLAEKLHASDAVSHQLGTVFSVLCAAPAYLDRHGTPRSLTELHRHACMEIVTPVTESGEWTFAGPAGRETLRLPHTTFKVNIAEAMAVAVREGLGVALLPIYSAIAGLRKGEFVRVLPDYTAQEMHVYALHLPRQYLDVKVRTFIDFLRRELGRTLAADEATLCEQAAS